MLAIDLLLTPITPDNPCGADLAFAPEVDEIARARLADDPSLEQGAWVTALKEADWKFVGKRCAALLETRSKDLQLAAWLAEASTRTGGMRGLADGLGLVAALWEERLLPFEANLRAGIAARRGPLAPVDPDPGWAAAGARVCARIARVAGVRALDVAHTGPTAVPGLAASIIRPMIDVPVTVSPPAIPSAPARVTCTSQGCCPASCTNLADARACRPRRLVIGTSRRAVTRPRRPALRTRPKYTCAPPRPPVRPPCPRPDGAAWPA